MVMMQDKSNSKLK